MTRTAGLSNRRPSETRTPETSPAHGYARLTHDDEGKIEDIRSRMTELCNSDKITLEAIYFDRDTADDSLNRPGLEKLLANLLCRRPGAVVVVLSLDHLSPLPATRTALMTLIGRTGTRLVTLDQSEQVNGYCSP